MRVGADLQVRPARKAQMLIDKVRQFVCGLEGHQMVRHFEPTRICLKCPCGYETSGWKIRETNHVAGNNVQFDSRTRELAGNMCSAR